VPGSGCTLPVIVILHLVHSIEYLPSASVALSGISISVSQAGHLVVRASKPGSGSMAVLPPLTFDAQEYIPGGEVNISHIIIRSCYVRLHLIRLFLGSSL
jgi:hypothetical protein